MPRRGDSAGKACGTSYLFPLHYSLKTFPFPHGFVLWWSANCESLSHASGVPAPFDKGALRRAAADNAHGSFQRIVTAPPVPGIGGLPPNLLPIPSSLFPEIVLRRYKKPEGPSLPVLGLCVQGLDSGFVDSAEEQQGQGQAHHLGNQERPPNQVDVSGEAQQIGHRHQHN